MRRNYNNPKPNFDDTIVSFGFEGKIKTKCGTIKNAEVYDYLETLKHFQQTKDRCVRYGFRFLLCAYQCAPQGVYSQYLNIFVTNSLHMKRPCGATNYTECPAKIKNGQCIDPFVRENIGKRFLLTNTTTKGN